MSPILGSSKLFSWSTVFHQRSRQLRCSHSYINSGLLTSQEVATALRPFYFVVHPDRFWQFPEEKDTNEKSLKQLNAHLESMVQQKKTQAMRVTFYMRQKQEQDERSKAMLKQVNIDLSKQENVNAAVHQILSQCQLPTDYLKKIGKSLMSQSLADKQSIESKLYQKTKFTGYRGNLDVFWMRQDGRRSMTTEEVEQLVRNKSDQGIINFLKENANLVNERLKQSKPIREEVSRLCNEIKQELLLNELIWTCGWSSSHFRGCLISLKTLAQQHPSDMAVLKGKTLVFGRQTGVSFDGQVTLSIEDVRHNWLELIRMLYTYQVLLKQLPVVEATLSGALRGMSIDHRKFRPAVMVQKYIQQLQKLTSACGEYLWEHGFPPEWPQSMAKYQLVVECEAGPLMLSPTGQFIVPASCPAFLLIDFISANMRNASHLQERYSSFKAKETFAIDRSLATFGLESLDKDDNVTPELMVNCLQKLLVNSMEYSRFLRGNRLRVSHYYSVLQDGVVCIPWNFSK